MSHDTIDDLHLAEDTLGQVRSALEAVQAFAEANPGVLPAGLAGQVSQAVSAGKEYCRCEYDETDGYECSDDCGCPADHEHPHHGD